MIAGDIAYWSHRAEREAVAAAGASDQHVGALHAELSRLYAVQVICELDDRTPPRAATRA